jgi:hypothetical protein
MNATISSDNLTSVLLDSSPSTSYTFNIPKSVKIAKDDDSDGTLVMTLDTSFEGFTPLNSFDDPEEHIFEYISFCVFVYSMRHRLTKSAV